MYIVIDVLLNLRFSVLLIGEDVRIFLGARSRRSAYLPVTGDGYFFYSVGDAF